MFKKALETRSHQRLSGADRKKLRRTIKQRFSRVSVDDDDTVLDSIFPPKSDITVSKFPNRVLVYAVEGGFPIFFDIDGRGSDIFPTVYSLWQAPDMLPSFVLKGGEVSQFIIGGADLMFPGIAIPPEGLPSFSAGEIWSVKVPGNPAPIAVGSTTMSNTEAAKAGWRGKALRITHYYGDSLWESVEGQFVPNAGFYKDVVLADPASLQASSSSGEKASRDEDEEGSWDDAAEDRSLAEVEAGNDDTAVDIASGVADLALSLDDTAADNEAVAEDQHPLSPEEMDLLLDKCLLQALHTTVKGLPMPGSTLWSNHILPCRPPGVTLDIKKSSHKKLSKWLLAKSSEKLINVREDKHKKEAVLYTINRSHPEYVSFKPEKQKVEKPEETADQPAAETRSSKTLEVSEVYKSSVHVNPIFTAVGADKGALYSASEATDIVYKYVENENLVKPTDKSCVTLDALLCDVLYKGVIKKGTTFPTEIHKRDLGPKFVSRMQPHHVVFRGNESVVRKGGLKTVQIMTERRQGNKKMTKLSGMEQFLIDPDSLASELQKKFACSTTIAELPGKKGHEVLVQGGVIENLAKHLIEQYGIPKKYIEVMDKTRRG